MPDLWSEPFALATDSRTGAECAVFWPTWSDKTTLDVRYVVQGRKGGRGRMRGRKCAIAGKHLTNLRPFHDKQQIFEWFTQQNGVSNA